MNKDSIVFALANPVPEILPSEAKEAGAKIVATGRSDFPNQVNNSLIFPAVFRGALDARAMEINDEMVIEASLELYRHVKEKGIREDYIIPRMDEWEIYPRVASAVAYKAVNLGLARIRKEKEEFFNDAKEIIYKSREILIQLVRSGMIS